MHHHNRHVIITVGLICFLLALGIGAAYLLYGINNSNPDTFDEITTTKPENLVINIPEPCTYGRLTILNDEGDVVYQHTGSIDIINDGTDGEHIDICVQLPKKD